MKIFDSHTHLNDEAFWGNEQTYLDHARKLGVKATAQVGSNTVLNQRALELAEKYPTPTRLWDGIRKTQKISMNPSEQRYWNS